MPRGARDHAEGHWYHVFNRGARRWPTFRCDADRRAFLALLVSIVDDFGVEVHAYCLMGNHYHLLLRCPRRNIAKAMGHLGQMYTQQFNHHHEVDGAHVEFFRGVANPLAIKIGPAMTAEWLQELIALLNPNNEPGRLTLIHRFGAKDIEETLAACEKVLRNSRQEDPA